MCNEWCELLMNYIKEIVPTMDHEFYTATADRLRKRTAKLTNKHIYYYDEIKAGTGMTWVYQLPFEINEIEE